MARFGFCGGSYQSQAVTADCQVTRGWYPEALESGQGKSAMAMYPTPGSKTVAALKSPVRGMELINGRAFAVGGDTFYELFEGSFGYGTGGYGLGGFGGPANIIGTIKNDGLPVSIAESATQILVAGSGKLYCFTFATNKFVEVDTTTGVALQGPVSQVGYSDGLFVALLANSQKFQISKFLDGTVWDPADIAQVSVFAENITSMQVDHREIWFLGEKRSVVYYNSGNPLFPYEPIPGAFIEQGCGARFATVKLDNTIMWIGIDERGHAIAWRASGYTPTRVSTHAIEFAWQSYPKISDAVAYSWQYQGHSFWRINFPSANNGLGVTWEYDVATNLWHEVDFWNNGKPTAHRSQCHMFALGRHFVGDWNSGNIYEMSGAFGDDDGQPIHRLRRAPHVSTEQQWMFHSMLQVDVETGLGPSPPLLDGEGNARGPQWTLRFSDDGGHTWSNGYTKSSGQAGEFKKRLIWWRLGRSRDRVYELSYSDSAPARIIDAYLQASPAFQVPSERLSRQMAKVT